MTNLNIRSLRAEQCVEEILKAQDEHKAVKKEDLKGLFKEIVERYLINEVVVTYETMKEDI
jgi:phosphoribosylformylglycinamidine (FGAM) synthase PurS component